LENKYIHYLLYTQNEKIHYKNQALLAKTMGVATFSHSPLC